MSKRNQPTIDVPIEFSSEVAHDHYRIKNWVATEWAPIIRPMGMILYNIYSAQANWERGRKWFISLRTLSDYLNCDTSTINMYNWLLELCGLIRIEPGEMGYANEYVILEPPRVTQKRLNKIVDILQQPVTGQGTKSKYPPFKRRTISAIVKWKSLAECRPTSQVKQNVSSPAPRPVAPSPNKTTETSSLALELAEHLGHNVAFDLLQKYGEQVCRQQLEWWPQRCEQARKSERGLVNPAGLLRRSIERNWSAPQTIEQESFMEELIRLGFARPNS